MDACAPARTIVGMSGGVDSSVAALLLRDAGEPIAGLFMQNWADDGSGDCRADDDRRDAVARLRAARHADPFPRFLGRVLGRRVRAFPRRIRRRAARRTRTCCATAKSSSSISSMPRARSAPNASPPATTRASTHATAAWRLLRAVDRNKDQSYFLHQLGQEQLAATLFPLGDLQKTRRAPHRARGASADPREEGFHRHLLHRRARLPRIPGAATCRRSPARSATRRDASSASIRACSISPSASAKACTSAACAAATPAPWYVVGKDVARNVLVVDQGSDSPYLLSTRCVPNRRTGSPARRLRRGSTAPRRRATASTTNPARSTVRDDGTLEVRFARPQRAVTPGQSLVLYDGDVCLGGAVIAATDAPLEQTHPTPATPHEPAPHERLDERVLALAGLVQALRQVRQIAETGQADAAVLGTAMDSVFRIDAGRRKRSTAMRSAVAPGCNCCSTTSAPAARARRPAAAPGLPVMKLERHFAREGVTARKVHEGILALARPPNASAAPTRTCWRPWAACTPTPSATCARA